MHICTCFTLLYKFKWTFVKLIKKNREYESRRTSHIFAWCIFYNKNILINYKHLLYITYDKVYLIITSCMITQLIIYSVFRLPFYQIFIILTCSEHIQPFLIFRFSWTCDHIIIIWYWSSIKQACLHDPNYCLQICPQPHAALNLINIL